MFKEGLIPYIPTLDGAHLTSVPMEDFGDGTVLVREIPSDISAEDTRAALEELGEKLTACRSVQLREIRAAGHRHQSA